MTNNNKINIELLNSLLDFNFVYQKSLKSNKINNRFFLKKYSSKNITEKVPFVVLEPLELIKSLKQTIRMFQYLKKSARPMLQLDFNYTFLNLWFSYLLKESAGQNSFYPIEYKKIIPSIRDEQFTVLFRFGKQKSLIEMKKLFAEEIFIINYFNNINNDFNDFGTYQFKSSVDDWKKLIFFFILIKKHYTKI